MADLNEYGKRLRREIDLAYKEENIENTRPFDATNVFRKIIERYVSNRKSRAQAESILRSAGFIIYTMPANPKINRGYTAARLRLRSGLIGYSALAVDIFPEDHSASDGIERIDVSYYIETL